MKAKKHWYDYLWIVTPIYFSLGFFNIMFAWIGMIFFCLPLIISIFGGGKLYCNRYCDRGQFFTLLGKRLGLSFDRPTPRFISSPAFRYGFLIFFFIMFFQMLFTTYLVGAGAKDLGESIKLLWTFRLPWNFAYHGTALPLWTAQFAFGFYSIMLTSTIIGLVFMIFFKPRSWCVFCPMGTMTQLICRLRAREANPSSHRPGCACAAYTIPPSASSGSQGATDDARNGNDSSSGPEDGKTVEQ